MRLPERLPGWLRDGGYAGSGVGGVVTPPAPVAASEIAPTTPYEFECWRGSTWLGPLPGVWDASRTRGLNTWETLTFSVLGNHGQAESLRSGCQVWAWRGGILVGKWWVVRAETGAGADRVLRVTAASALWLLTQEGVGVFNARTRIEPVDPEEEPYYEPITLAAAVDGLLALQTQTPAITVGNISGSIGASLVNLRMMAKSIEEWLRELRKIVGGFYEVGLDNKLYWRSTPVSLRGASSRLWLRDGGALLGLRHSIDYGNYANRVQAIGAGGWYENSLTVTRNNGAAQADLGRIVKAVVVDRAIKDLPTLTKWADRVLAERSRPRLGLDVDVVDLGALRTGMLSNSAAAFEAGSRVALLHAGTAAVAGDAWVLEATHSLDQPSRVTVTLGDPEAAAAAAAEDGAAEGLLDAVAALAAKLKVLEGEVDGELEEEVGLLRDAFDALAGTVTTWEGLPDGWADALADELGGDPAGGPLVDALEDWFGSGVDGSGPTDHEERIQALEEGGGAPDPGTGILPVISGTSQDGTSDDYARVDHEHQGVPIKTSGDPPETGECLLFSEGMLYMAVGGEWLLISHLEAEEEEEE